MRLLLPPRALLHLHPRGLTLLNKLPSQHSPTLSLFVRLQSNLSKPSSPSTPSSSPSPSPPQPLPESFRKTIPGETEQSNSILSRLPTFPLRSKNTLLPKPGVPTAATTPLRSMMEILNKKATPELIYEAEPHQSYFIICGALAVIFAIYGLTFMDWGFRAVWELYQDDQEVLTFVTRAGMCVAITSVAIGVFWLAIQFPTRLIRRIWIVPGDPKLANSSKFVRFTTHPLLPNRATPVYTIPLENLNRGFRSKVFTRNGIYGTHDRASFFFLLKENDKRFGYWIVDRNGWFWGDGRVFDILFGKESLEEAQRGQSYNEKLKEASERLKDDREKLKKEAGPLWQVKTTKKMFQKDLKKMAQIVSSSQGYKKQDDNRQLPKK